jgi:putative RecB family exonuclease
MWTVRGPDSISPSQLTLYLTCSLKYRFEYIDRLPKAFRSASLALGTAIHAALQWLHNHRKTGRNPPLDEVLRVFDADWYAQSSAIEILGEEGGDALRLKAKELLSAYYHLPAKPIRGVEIPFQVPLVNPATGEILDLPLRGRIDLIEGEDEIVDFKTPKATPPLDGLPDNLQLTAYAYAYQILFGRPAKELRLMHLVKTKRPKIEEQKTWREPEDYERLFNVANEVLKGIRAGIFIPNRGCWLCSDCEYDQDCREWAGNEK